ncbi:MAG TPA: transglycosylase SLT domain-containing protein [Bacteroidia bacterium]|nr:transglycosylase SLT domain-containing protein [Bacteroidia bacterium]
MLKTPFLTLTGIFILFIGTSCRSQEAAPVHPDVVRVSPLNDTVMRYLVQTNQIYDFGLDTLPQIRFWRRIMHMPPDSALVSLASNRLVFCSVAVADWEKLGDAGQTCFRDSCREVAGADSLASVLFTKGKNDFYDAAGVIPQIDKAIPIFVREGVDPFYAQAILLIESPGKMLRSKVGAMGPFQLMKGVAVKLGLKVNRHVDERKDFDKSAWAASKLIRTICIPYTNSMLDKRGICYDPNDLWYRLLVLHVYHAGAGNVEKAFQVMQPTEGGIGLITTLWQTSAGSFGKASQAYSQLAISALIELDLVTGRTKSEETEIELADRQNEAEKEVEKQN